MFAAGSLASWGRVYALAMATAGVAGRLRARLFAALILQEKEFFDEKAAGELGPILAEVCLCRCCWFVEKSSILHVCAYFNKNLPEQAGPTCALFRLWLIP